MGIETFAGARVAITGGATGIGLALAQRMAREGARLSLCGLDADALDWAAQSLSDAGAPEVRVQVCDVTDRHALQDWIDATAEAFGGIDVGWNNAGVMQASQPIQDLDLSEYARVMATNLEAVFHGSQMMARRMIRQGTPALLINTGSENSLFHAVPGGGAYVASKMAVRALTESLRDDTPDHIAVKLLCPGFVNTPLGPPEQFRHGMDLERFADIVFPLLTSDQFYLVSHGYNAVRVKQDAERILADIEAGAASAEETQAFDTYTLLGRSR